jgi:hypothetical protein
VRIVAVLMVLIVLFFGGEAAAKREDGPRGPAVTTEGSFKTGEILVIADPPSRLLVGSLFFGGCLAVFGVALMSGKLGWATTPIAGALWFFSLKGALLELSSVNEQISTLCYGAAVGVLVWGVIFFINRIPNSLALPSFFKRREKPLVNE